MYLRKILVRQLLNLYPDAWRKEYGEELRSILLARPLTIPVIGDVFLNAMRQNLRRPDPRLLENVLDRVGLNFPTLARGMGPVFAGRSRPLSVGRARHRMLDNDKRRRRWAGRICRILVNPAGCRPCTLRRGAAADCIGPGQDGSELGVRHIRPIRQPPKLHASQFGPSSQSAGSLVRSTARLPDQKTPCLCTVKSSLTPQPFR